MKLSFLALGLVSIAHAQLPTSPVLIEVATYGFSNHPVADILTQLRKETQLEFRPDPRIANRTLTAFSKDQTRRDFLTHIAQALEAEWIADGETIRLRPLAAVIAREKADWGDPQARSRAELLKRIQVLTREANRPLAELHAEFESTFTRLQVLRAEKPPGWSDEYQRLSVRMDEILRPFAARQLLRQALLNAPTNWGPVIDGRRVSFLVPKGTEPGSHYFSFFGDATRGELWFEDTYGKIPILTDEPVVREFKPEPSTFRPTYVGPELTWRVNSDAQVLAQVHKSFGLNVYMEGGRSTQWSRILQNTSVSKTFSFLNSFKVETPNSLIFENRTKQWHRQADPAQPIVKAVEAAGPNDMRSVVALAQSYRGPLLAANSEQFGADFNWRSLAGDHAFFDFFAQLNPSQFARITSGKALSLSELNPSATALANHLLFRPPSDQSSYPLWMQPLLQNPNETKDLYVYFERYASPQWRSITPDGKTVEGGINDGAETAFPDVAGVHREPFFRYEMNLYVGYEFARSVRHQVVLESRIPPPAPKPDPNAKPPEHHEGHGPGDVD